MNPFVPRFVVSEKEINALPVFTVLLDTRGVTRTRRWPDSLDGPGWAAVGKIAISSKALADGKPLLVLWNPAEPWPVFSAWLMCLDILDPDRGLDADDHVRLPAGSPGQARFKDMVDLAEVSEIWDNPTEAEQMQALAGNDFAQCWSKNGAKK